MKDYGWIGWIVALVLIFGGAAYCNVAAPCSWYKAVHVKNVPARCVIK